MNISFVRNGRSVSYSKRAPQVMGEYIEVLDKWLVDTGKNVFVADNIPLRFGGVPAVWQFVQPPQGYKPVTITKQMSDWWWMITKEVSPARYTDADIAKTLLNLTYWKKAFDNKMGWGMADDPRNEYFSGDRKGQGHRQDMGLLYCCAEGSTYKRLGEARVAGRDCAVIAAIDALKPETWPQTYKGNEWLFTVATNAARDSSARNGYRIDPFPFLGGSDISDRSKYSNVVVPLFVNNETRLYIEKKYTKQLGEGSKTPAYPYGQR